MDHYSDNYWHVKGITIIYSFHSKQMLTHSFMNTVNTGNNIIHIMMIDRSQYHLQRVYKNYQNKNRFILYRDTHDTQ